MNQYIKESVSRFLGWKLPADFAPDAGITFKPNANPDSQIELQYKHEPTGTNLFNDPQATAMLTHVCKPLTDRIVELGDESNHLRAVTKTAKSFLKDGEVKMVAFITELEAQLAGAEAEITALKQGLHRATFNNESLEKGAEWIPVSERLPDDRKPYLVNLVNVATNEPYVAQSRLNPAKTRFYVEYDNRTDTPLEEVTHWMRLPAAPAPLFGELVDKHFPDGIDAAIQAEGKQV